MTLDPHGRLWVATDKQIAMWNGTRFQDQTPTNSIRSAKWSFSASPVDGAIWAGTGGSVHKAVGRRWTTEAGALKNVFTGNMKPRRRARRPSRRHLALRITPSASGTSPPHGEVRHFGAQEGFPGERVNCLFEDHEGDWWAGLDVGGLVRIRERRFQIVDTGGQLSAKPARSVCEKPTARLDRHARRWPFPLERRLADQPRHARRHRQRLRLLRLP